MGRTSLAKVRANKRNALKSTGPRTAKGKMVISRNALKHGLLAKAVLITDGNGKEKKTEFEALIRDLCRELRPEGVLEQMLVEKIAVSYWRLRRVLRCEVGAIRGKLDNLALDARFDQTDRFNSELRLAVLDPSRSAYKRNSHGIQRLVEVLDNVRAIVEESGENTAEAKGELIQFYGNEPNSTTIHLLIINELGKEDNQLTDQPLPSEKRKAFLLDAIDNELKKTRQFEEIFREQEELELESTLLGASLPPKETIEKLLRYETSIERQLYRGIDQLERLQRQRRGEAVPPPINVELNNLT